MAELYRYFLFNPLGSSRAPHPSPLPNFPPPRPRQVPGWGCGDVSISDAPKRWRVTRGVSNVSPGGVSDTQRYL